MTDNPISIVCNCRWSATGTIDELAPKWKLHVEDEHEWAVKARQRVSEHTDQLLGQFKKRKRHDGPGIYNHQAYILATCAICSGPLSWPREMLPREPAWRRWAFFSASMAGIRSVLRNHIHQEILRTQLSHKPAMVKWRDETSAWPSGVDASEAIADYMEERERREEDESFD